MIKDVPLTGIFVDDQEAALDFYTGKLGLVLDQLEPYAEGARWITVSPKGARTRIVSRRPKRLTKKPWSEGRTARRC
jgi:catechol 2,3-dioxygenase-like lactoylglutathione lyase family enzyme